MPITLNDLTVNFAHLDAATLLEDWRWLIGGEKHPVLISVLGDAFLQDMTDGSIHLLSAGEGALAAVAESAEEFKTLLGEKAFVTEYFAPHVLVKLRNRGVDLKPGQVLGYKVPPHLGGKYSEDNLEPTDIALHFSLLGQLHAQTQTRPPGTPISGASIK